MPDTNDLKKWLKLNDLQASDVVSIVDGGSIRTFEFTDKSTNEKRQGKALEIGVQVNGGTKKSLTINNLSVTELSKEWGSNTDKWAGHKAIVDTAKSMSFGKLTDLKFLRPAPNDVETWK